MTMTDNKPYLIRAIHEWICDNNCTPYLYVDTRHTNVVIPEHLYGDNPLILNISPTACQHLHIANEQITFQARFSGSVYDLSIPMPACLAIIARENGLGMSFEPPEKSSEATENQSTSDKKSEATKKDNNRSHLKVVR